jgi:protein-S-isoprenylcysteine O-methyltransferase Ste14
MVVNRNLEPTARIREERGHQVATTGPYRYIRHPMYLGIVLQIAGLPLLLGSAWGLLPAVATAACIVVRILARPGRLIF